MLTIIFMLTIISIGVAMAIGLSFLWNFELVEILIITTEG